MNGAQGLARIPDDDAPLSEQQVRLMAWLDNEMPAAERSAFEHEMSNNRELAMEAAKLKELADLTSSLATSEPTETEMRRFWTGFYNRTEWRIGWILLMLGVVVILGQGFYWLAVADIAWWLKGAVLCAVGGVGILLWNTIRLKMHTSRFDRYRGVMR